MISTPVNSLSQKLRFKQLNPNHIVVYFLFCLQHYCFACHGNFVVLKLSFNFYNVVYLMWLTVCLSSLWLLLSRDSGQTARSLLGILPDAEQIQCFSFSTFPFQEQNNLYPILPYYTQLHIFFMYISREDR